MHFFDGFRTSHEIQKIEKWDYADLKEMCNMEAVEEFRAKALNPEHPKMRGSHENGDVFFQHREACNPAYEALPAVVEKYMAKINEKLGTNYDLFNYYGAADADRVIIAMGSICDVAEEVVDYLTAKGEKVGLVHGPPVSSLGLQRSAEGPAQDRQEDRRSGPHQGARLPGRAPVPGCCHHPA